MKTHIKAALLTVLILSTFSAIVFGVFFISEQFTRSQVRTFLIYSAPIFVITLFYHASFELVKSHEKTDKMLEELE